MQGVFHMVLWEHVICGGQFLGENGVHFEWDHYGEKSYRGKTILEGESYPGRHHGIAPFDKCH